MNETANTARLKQARESLSGKWGIAIATCLIFVLAVGGIQVIPVIGPLAALVIGGPLTLGMAIFALSLSRNEDARLEQLFDGFQHFLVALVAYLLVILYTILWMLLLIVPGIIASISYSMTFYIIAEDRSISANDAIDKSKQMMDGYKMKYFTLMLRFLALGLLCILTLGIGFLWLIPFIQVTTAKFYDDIKSDTTFVEEITTQPILE